MGSRVVVDKHSTTKDQMHDVLATERQQDDDCVFADECNAVVLHCWSIIIVCPSSGDSDAVCSLTMLPVINLPSDALICDRDSHYLI